MTYIRLCPLVGFAVLWASGGAVGQTFNFEPPYPASPTGTVINGVDGWYQPPLSSTGPGRLYTYAANAVGLVPHPDGGDQFEAGLSGGGLYARAQRDMSFEPGGVWTMECDVAARWMGPLPADDFVGSLSLQNSQTSRSFQVTAGWGKIAIYPSGPFATNHTSTADRFHLAIGYYANAQATTVTDRTPSAAWRDLHVNHWYRVRVKWDFGTSRVLECGLQDLTGGGGMQFTDVSATGMYLRGGPNSTLPLPTGIRLFAGNNALVTTPANLCAFDNVKISRVCYPDCNADGVLTVQDFGCFQTAFVSGNMYADCNSSGTLTVQDFGCFQTAFVAGCP